MKEADGGGKKGEEEEEEQKKEEEERERIGTSIGTVTCYGRWLITELGIYMPE